MKNIAKILTALAAVAGVIYIIATYGEQIVAWAKKVLNALPKCPCCEEVETVEPTMEIAVAEEVIEVSGEEVVAEVVPEVVSEIQAEDISATQNLSNSEPQQLTPYYIVGGSFKTEESAEKCLNGIKNQGFENASTLDKNEKGYIRVYYESFAEKADALIRLDVIKSDYNESAWLLFQK